MNCKRIKELIMTDYIDGEISGSLRKEIEEHLNKCSNCRELEELLRKKAIDPFKKMAEIKVPESAWYRIKASIEEKQAKGVLAGLRKSWQAISCIPKPALAMAAVITVIFMAVLFIKLPFNNQNEVNDYLGEQIEFFSYLAKDEAAAFEADYIDLGTGIEEYFL